MVDDHLLGASYNPTTGQTAPVNDMYFFTSKLQTNPHEVNFDFALQNVECGIFGKYRIHCQLDFLCEVQLPQFISLNGGFLKGCESVIPPSVLQGYRTNYKINEKDQELLVKLFNEHQQKFKVVREALDKRRKEGKPQESEDYAKYREFEDKKPLDIVNIEKFLYLFDLIDRYLNELEVMKARLDQMTNRTDNGKLGAPIQQTPQKINLARFGEVFRTAKAINLSVMRESMTDIQKASQATCFTSEALCRDRITELENMVSMLVQLLSGMELNFKGVESYLEEDSKMFIERDRYFIPLEKPNTVYDLMDERYMVDINYPSDENFFSKYKHLISFLDETRLDRQQQKWFRRVPFKVHYLKPVNKEEEGIFVENAMDEVKRKKEIEDLVQTFQYYKTIDL
jgi:hypothetical protein